MSKHLGDFDASTVVYGKFTTFRPSTGAAYTLGGTPALSVYKDNSTTQSTTGVTLTADFDSVTGLNHFAIDTSADGTFYAAGSFFDIVITTGTVDSVSVVGAVVGSFTIRKNSALKPTTAGRTLDVSVGGEGGVDWANVGSATTTQDLSGTTVKTATDVETDTADIQSRLPAALTAGGNIKSDTLAINAVATSSVTTVNANIGTTNAINFFGSGVSGYVKADVRTVAGNAQSGGDLVANQDAIYDAVQTAIADIASIAVDTVNALVAEFGTIPTSDQIATAVYAALYGSGTDQCTAQVLVGGVGVQGAETWITTDVAGDNRVAGPALTDSNGEVTFLLTAGNVYYLWSRKDGMDPIQGGDSINPFTAVAD